MGGGNEPSEVAPLVVTVEYVEKGLNGAGDSVVSDSAEDILLEIVKGKRMCYGWACTVEVVVVVVVVGGVKPDVSGFGALWTRAYILLTLTLTCATLAFGHALLTRQRRSVPQPSLSVFSLCPELGHRHKCTRALEL